jgi:small-conductance mechanosensitive channel
VIFEGGASDLLAWITDPARLGALLRALVYVVAGLTLARAARYTIKRTTATTLSTSQQQLFARLAYYAVLGLFLVSALRQFGFDFTVLLGAAGIVTVAVGFASQTSASNLISGLFLVVERAVQAGDIVTVDDVTGEVLSVDLLSTKLRTFDNLLVRIPNETMVKTRITTINRFPIRRFDLQVGVAYDSDLQAVQRTLFEVAHANPLCLDEPAPLLISQGFGASSIDYQLSVWAKTEHWLTLRNSITREVKEAFDAAGIEIPFPQRTLQGGRDPIDVRLVAPGGGAEGIAGAADDGPDGGRAGDDDSSAGEVSARRGPAAAPRSGDEAPRHEA